MGQKVIGPIRFWWESVWSCASRNHLENKLTTCVLLPCFNAQPGIFAVMNCCIVALSLFSSDILTWSPDSLYSVQWHIKKESECRWTCILCQQTSPKHWFGNMNMTSNCDITNSAHQYKWPPRATEWNPQWKFSAYATAGLPYSLFRVRS